jgi:hypothetical protein
VYSYFMHSSIQSVRPFDKDAILRYRKQYSIVRKEMLRIIKGLSPKRCRCDENPPRKEVNFARHKLQR